VKSVCCEVRSRDIETLARVHTRSLHGDPYSSSEWIRDHTFGTGTALFCQCWSCAHASLTFWMFRNCACSSFQVDTCRSCSVRTAATRGTLKHGDEDAEAHARAHAREREREREREKERTIFMAIILPFCHLVHQAASRVLQQHRQRIKWKWLNLWKILLATWLCTYINITIILVYACVKINNLCNKPSAAYNVNLK